MLQMLIGYIWMVFSYTEVHKCFQRDHINNPINFNINNYVTLHT